MASSKGPFNRDPLPLHVGRKSFNDTAQLRRSRSSEDLPLRRKMSSSNVNHHDHIPHMFPNNQRSEKIGRHRNEDIPVNASRCPWQPEQLSARVDHSGRKAVDTSSYYREKKHGRPTTIPNWPGNQRATACWPNRQPEKKHEGRRVSPGWSVNIESKETEWKPTKKTSSAMHRCHSADFVSQSRHESRHIVRRPEQEPTSLFGRSSSMDRPRGKAIRSNSVEGGPRSPFATHLGNDMSPFEEASRSSGRSRTNSLSGIQRVDSVNIQTPYDATSGSMKSSGRFDAGKRAEFRPRTRIFSGGDTHANIFGTGN
eukprot:TRINITY_DN1546_c0_g1_i1.p1 TRINITY_DN1546_c0_g1~~TRINITY_DN1546_c0_g1_i1.p1  ORF type:complete len:323 (+),score=47.92 TRINITY_DN1546_c0_g1_i1:35-970(+)